MATATVDLGSIDQTADTGQTADVDQTQVTSDGADGTQQDGQQQDGTQQQTDGRRGPADVRGAVKAAAEALPEQAATIKKLGDAYFRADAYAKVFPTVQDASSAKQLFDAVGGVDGVTQIQQRQQQYDAQDEAIKTGNPEAIDSAFKNFPDGMAALAPHYLDTLARTNPESYATAVAPHAMGLLERAGVLGHIQQLAAETDPARKAALANQLDQWMQKQGQDVKQLRTAPTKNPMEGKLLEQKTALEQQQEQFFSKQVDTAVNTASTPELNKIVDQYAKTYKLNDVQKQRFNLSLANRVVQEMLADDTFKKQDQIRRTGKDVQKVADFRASEFQRRLGDAAFKEAQELYGATQKPSGGTGEVKPNTAKTAPGGGPLLVSRAMTPGDLDMSKDPNQYLFIANKGYRKDGTFVTWK
jgi:hypothetical protein